MKKNILSVLVLAAASLSSPAYCEIAGSCGTAGQSITGITYSTKDSLEIKNYCGTTFDKCTFKEVNTVTCNFDKAKLEDTKIEKGLWFEPKFEDTVVENSRFSDTYFECPEFYNVKCCSSNFTGGEWDWALISGELRNVVFENISLKNIQFIMTTFNHVTFRNVNMEESYFSNTDLTNVDFINVNLKNAVFENITATSTMVEKLKAAGAREVTLL